MRMDWPICLFSGSTVTGCAQFELKHLENFAGTFPSVQVPEDFATKLLFYNLLQVRPDLGQTVDAVRRQAVKLYTMQSNCFL